ncbi:gamma carbonic anhydrase family protein [Bengtsoniella intestinalis]|uniref:gamma carbonic anhydrase family protein n=1 Tax=Bengtsoniella intestinalis TaxID=3073143 RepID=UPI00391FBE98
MLYNPYPPSETVLFAKGAIVTGNVTLGNGVSIWYNAVLRGDDGPIVVGDNTNIQDCAVLHEPTTVGAGCTIGHNAIVHGCTIGDNCLIGMGSIVLNNAIIGNNCIVGAGAVVTGKMNAPDGSMLLGNPARIVRSLTEAEIQSNIESMQGYLDAAAQYKKETPHR